MSNLEELNELLNFFQIAPEQEIPESHLEQAGISLKETPSQSYNKNEKWRGKYKMVGKEPTTPGTWQMPTSGGLLSAHNSPVVLSPGHFHSGIDIGGEKGQPIKAIGPGVVSKTWTESNNKLGGNSLLIKHNNGITSYYAHLDSVNVRPGEEVGPETTIGSLGNSGVLPGGGRLSPHLHMQIKINNQDIDPFSIIGKPINVEAAIKNTLMKLS